ncbi:PIN domain-containing protein [Chloroflexus sp.]|uniref:PIN domain-containing protein n=1 Tax=Chloroflexus sp. TaxID=1904827 RepID=UPI002ACDD0D1|nr:PIN domain-containing protein [Chloroflexus sp.]
MCAVQRPLDTPSHVRIQIEAEAVLGLISLGEAGHLTLVSSDALHYENDQNPLLLRRKYGSSVLARATETIALTEAVHDRALQFLAYSLKPRDSLHVALAEAGKADYICTCDDRLRR